jgi:CubicO group peptidase (beta-lactamase class C family)
MTLQHASEGNAHPIFRRCLEAFSQNLVEGEAGAACAIYHDGELVLDAWGGVADVRDGRPWSRDTAVPVFSVTKGVAALVLLQLADRGLIGLDQPVARYWPEFGVHGKERVTVREALAHRAGVPAISGEITVEDLQDSATMATRVAAETPVHEPGQAHIYHALTIGWITSELVQRATGKRLGAWLKDELCVPYHLNLGIGRRSHDQDVAYLETPPEHDTPDVPADLLAARAISLNGLIPPRVSGVAAALNQIEFQRCELAGANCIADARSLAKLYAGALGSIAGMEGLPSSRVDDALRVVSEGVQFSTAFPGPRWGTGVMLPFAVQPMLGAGSFGHDGMGGSLAFAHAPSRTSFAYVRNRMAAPNVVDPLVYRVVNTLAECLGLDFVKE